ncbi:MAG TPA: MFS transporter [Gaiellaceae bacterium]|jgi:EmrB/QacA subfamily drug resistance transporter
MSAEPQSVGVSTDQAPVASSLASRRGVAILLLLSLVQFMDVLDASILNIALPSIKSDLGFSQQSLQWVINGYILTYGGFLLLGGRMADLLGRRRVLITGLIVFAGASLVGGLAHTESLLIGARFAQGLGAAMLSPAALSTLTSTFRSARDRNTALGVWAAVSGIGGAAGVLFGGLLTEGPGWRWVLFVNVPFSAIGLAGAFVLLKGDRIRARLANFDALGAFLVTGGMLLLVYSLVKAPDVGWGAGRTIAGLAGAAVILAAFVVNELRARNPLVPMSILRVKGVAAADATQMVALAGFLPMFFFLTLYMQTVLGYSPIQTGVAYLPLTGGFIIAASISSQLFTRIGTKPVVVLGTVIAAGGLYWLSRVPVDGSYLSDILPGLLTVSIGMGGVFTGLTTAANAGVDQDKAGLAAGLLNTGQQLGAALGLAVLSAVATAQTKSVLSAGDGLAQAATHGYQRALLVGAFIVLAATVVALLTPNRRESPAAVVEEEPALDLAA